jgi:beta-xylosidase
MTDMRKSLSMMGVVLPLAAGALDMKPDDLVVRPVLDVPLRDPAVCRGADGAYYLTGTSASTRPDGSLDFDNNDGIYLWKSADRKTWAPLGQVWDLAAGGLPRFARLWQSRPDVPDGEPVRGVRAPEIHCLKGTYWIPFGMSAGGTGLLKSTSGKPEGPYAFVKQFTAEGFDPSLFLDGDASSADGAVYWVMGEGWVARLKDDLSDFAEPPRLLRPEPVPFSFGGKALDHDATVGTHGAFLFKEAGKYHLAAARHASRLGGRAAHDTYVACAEKIEGPYSVRTLMVPHGGQVTVFRDEGGRLWSTFGGDATAVFRDKPGIVGIRYDDYLKRVWTPTLEWVYRYGDRTGWITPVVVEAGPVARARPLDLPGLFEGHIRDPHVVNAPDGWYYLTGTVGHARMPDPSSPGHYAWRSRDLKTWEFMGEVWNTRAWKGPGSPYKPQPPRFCDLKQNFEGLWGPRISCVKGNFYIPWGPAYGGCYLLRSTTGKAEGPYEDVPFEFNPRHIAPTLFEDDDGSVYYLFGWVPEIARMKDDLSGLAEKPRAIGPGDGSTLGYEGPFMIKAHGKYILFTSETSGVAGFASTGLGSYDWNYCWADNVYGPYSKPRIAVPHGGCSSTFKGKDGRWYNTVFGSDGSAPFQCRLAVVPLDIRWENGEIAIEQAKQ